MGSVVAIANGAPPASALAGAEEAHGADVTAGYEPPMLVGSGEGVLERAMHGERNPAAVGAAAGYTKSPWAITKHVPLGAYPQLVVWLCTTT